MAPMSLPPGFRFHPTDEELVAYYLDRKINGGTIELEIIPEVDLYKCEPWDLPEKSFLPSKDMEWYFYSRRDRKYPNGSRTNRATRAGYWKATGKDRAVHSQKQAVGMKKTLVYYKGRAPHGVRTNWVMHEYRLIINDSISNSTSSNSSLIKDSYALCRIFKKTIIHVGKNKELEENGNVGIINFKESAWGLEEHHIHDTNGTPQISHGDESFDQQQDYPKFPSDTCSSDLTQGTDDLQSQFLPSDEANSSVNLYSLNVHDCSSDLIQEMEMEMEMEMGHCTMLPHYQLPYPPLALEDFPQINIATEGKTSKCEIIDDLMMYDKYRDCSSTGTNLLEEIFL